MPKAVACFPYMFGDDDHSLESFSFFFSRLIQTECGRFPVSRAFNFVTLVTLGIKIMSHGLKYGTIPLPDAPAIAVVAA